MQAKPRHLVRQESIHELENELSHLAPTVEGRIFMLDDIVSISGIHKNDIVSNRKTTGDHLRKIKENSLVFINAMGS